MKPILAFAIVAIACLTVAASTKDKDITVTTDKFTGTTTVEMKPFRLPSTEVNGILPPFLWLIAQEQGGKFGLIVANGADYLGFPYGAEVRVLADGKAIDLGHFALVDGGPWSIDGVVVSEIGAVVDRSSIEKMANAHTLEIEVAQWQSKIKPKDINRLKEFFSWSGYY